ncbi:hypothetical protein JXJ21_12360 [candidate division KSB1 bacterium]|nr:hypothetical protein [candidate division KSB1 bacterium]
MNRLIIYIHILLSFAMLMLSCEDDGSKVVGSLDHEVRSFKASEPEILADGISTTDIIAVIYDKAGERAYGMKVAFETTHGTIDEFAVSDWDGNAKLVLTSEASKTDLIAQVTATVVDTALESLPKTTPSPYKIELRVPDQKGNPIILKKPTDNTGTINIKFKGVSLDVEVDDPILPADGISETTVRIKLRETTTQKAIQNAEVRIGIKYGSSIGSAHTNALGISEVEIRSSKEAIDDTLTIEYGKVIRSVLNVSYLTPKLNLATEVAQVLADGQSKIQVIATLLAQTTNNPVVGAKVKFSTTAGIIQQSAITDEFGKARTDLIAGSEPDSAVKIIATFLTLSDTTTIAFVSIDVGELTLTASEEPLIRNGIAQKQIFVHALTKLGQPVRNGIIHLAADIGNAPESITTNTYGEATFNFTADAGNSDATATITASIGSATSTHTIRLLGVAFEVSTTPDSIPANGLATSNVRVHVKYTTTHLAIANHEIGFSTDIGTIPASAQTDGQGVALATYTASTATGLATITVFCGELTQNTHIHLLPNYPHTVTLSTTADPLLRNGIASREVSLKALNRLGQAVPNATIQLSADIGTVPSKVITDLNGNATFEYLADAGNSDATAIITASSGDAQATQTIKLLGVTIIATANPDSLPANGVATSEIRVQVKYTTTHQAISNQEIGFSTDVGTIPAESRTDNKGIASATFTANTTPGQAHISVAYGSLTRYVTVHLLPNFPDALTLSAATEPVLRDGASTRQFSLKALNKLGQPVPNATIQLSADRGKVPAKVVTDLSGNASFTYTSDAGTADATATVTAASGDAGASQTLDLTGVSVTIMATPDSLLADGSSSSHIRVIVKKTTSNVGIPNRVVEFATTLGVIHATVNTNEQGVSDVSYFAGDVPGTAVITARVGIITKSVNVHLLQNYPASITLTASDTPLLRDGIASKDVTLKAVNKLSQAVANATIKLSANKGAVPATVVTDKSGNASFKYISDAGASDDIATITATSGEAQASQTIALLGITLTVKTTPDSIPADGQTKSTIRVQVKHTTSQKAVTAHTIGFSTDTGTIPSNSETDIEGIAVANFTAGTVPGVAHITVFCGTLTRNINVYLLRNVANKIMLTVDSEPILRDGVSSKQISLKALLQLNQAAPNTTIQLSTDRGKVPATVVTDLYGNASFKYTSDAGASDAIATITASSGEAHASGTITLIGLTLTVTATPDSIPADGASISRVRAEVKLTTTNVGVARQQLTFATTLGTIQATERTDSWGVSVVTFFADIQPGTATVTVALGTISKSTRIFLFGNFPKTITLEASPNFIWVKGAGNVEQTIIRAVVLGVTGQPVGSGFGVKFTIVNGPNGGELIEPSSVSSWESAVMRTVNGVAQAKILAGTKSGTVEIRAELVDPPYNDIYAQQPILVIRSGPAYMWIDQSDPNRVISHASLLVEAGKQNVAFANPVEKISVTAVFGDKYNNPIEQGTAVYFTTTGGIITSDGITNSLGQASATLQNCNPFPYLKTDDPNQLTARFISNPNNESVWLDLSIPDFEGSEIENSMGNGDKVENDGVAVLLAHTWGRNQNNEVVKVWAPALIVFSSQIHTFTVSTDKSTLDIGEYANISIRLYDIHGNPVAAGSNLYATTTKGELSERILMPDAGHYGYGATYFTTQLTNNLNPISSVAGIAVVTIVLNSPNGSGKLTVPINLTLNTN